MFSKQDIERYFMAEKQLGLLFVIIGAVATVTAIVFFFLLKTPFFKGAAIPLFLLGLVELFAGNMIYKKSDADRIRNVYAFDMNPGQLKNEELPRMNTVLRNFAVMKWVETALVITGLALVFFFRSNTEQTFWYGLGLTLTIQILLLFIADTAAERRAKLYVKGVENHVRK